MSLEDRLRADLRRCISDSGRAQKMIAADLGITEKHLSYMLLGKARITLEWAEEVAEACGHQVVVSVIRPVREPQPARGDLP